MSELIEQQQRFAVAVARLIIAAEARGIPLRFGDAYRDPRATFPYSHPRSLHRERLAVDLIAEDGAHHNELHNLWETISEEAAQRIDGDLNHYSFARGDMS